MDDEPTCGKGVAANAPLPAKLAEMLTALADTLEAHRPGLDLDEPAGREEDAAYATLVDDFREITSRLKATSERMASYRTLPMATHDEAVMADPARMSPYARFIGLQRELAATFTASVVQGEQMLRDMPES
jgi:hypothetical protein